MLDKYKYLGTCLNSKLTLNDQLAHIKKSFFITHKLALFIKETSADMKVNLWTVFIRPLFEFTYPLLTHEKYATHKEKMLNLLRFSFRKFVGLIKHVDNDLVYYILGFKPDDRIEIVRQHTPRIYEAREQGLSLHTCPINTWEGQSLSRVACNIFKLINIQCGMCPAHPQARLTVNHYNTHHRLPDEPDMPNIRELIASMRQIIDTRRMQSPEQETREVSLSRSREQIQELINKLLNVRGSGTNTATNVHTDTQAQDNITRHPTQPRPSTNRRDGDIYRHYDTARIQKQQHITSMSTTRSAPPLLNSITRTGNDDNSMHYVYFDGASSGNPGPSGIGFALYNTDMQVLLSHRHEHQQQSRVSCPHIRPSSMQRHGHTATHSTRRRQAHHRSAAR